MIRSHITMFDLLLKN